MAMINTLRNKMGKIVVAFVAVAILSFTLNDILGSNSVFLGENVVGFINGEKITLEEFQAAMDFQERNFSVYQNRQPTEADRYGINDRAWLWLMNQYAFGPQYREIGVEVSSDEMWDMLQGSNIDPTIRAFFANPQTGEFDREGFMQFYQNRDQYDANALYVWNAVYPTIRPSRLRLKYENLMVRSTYVPAAEGALDYHNQTDVAEVEYLYVPFYSNSDTTVTDQVTDDLLRTYYNNRKERYKVDETRSLKYVTFPIIASADDTLEIREEVDLLAEEFTNVDDDELFANANTDGEDAFGRYHYGTMPYQLEGMVDTLEVGDIYGPVMEGGSYKIYKLSEVYQDTVDYARASHILIRWDDESDASKRAARDEATRILNEIRDGASFAAMARQYGTDNTAQVGGDLGWFDSNTMVEEFEKPVFDATQEGLIPYPVETDFGYHIIEVTGVKTNQMYAIAQIERIIGPSDRTVNDAYRKADLFQSEASDVEGFEALAAEQNLELLEETGLGAMDRTVGNLGTSARGMVQWLFRDGKVGKVSDIFDINEQYVVAVMTQLNEEGYSSMEDVRDDLRAVAIRDLEADYIMNKLGGMTGSLQEIAEAYGEGASVYESSSLNPGTNSLPNVGFDPVAVGKIFSLKQGETSQPFSTDNGVFIARMINLTVAPEVADYSSFSAAIQATRRNTTSSKLGDLIEREADVEDKRFRVY